jgi:hypothetical protein
MTARRCLLLALLLAFCSLGLSTAPAQTQAFYERLEIGAVNVTRINLALKEVDLRIGYLRASVSRPFEVAIWSASYGRGFLPMSAFGKPISNFTSWHEWDFSDWPPRSLVLRTIGPLPLPIEVNQFPCEGYQTEIIFGFNVTGIIQTQGPLDTSLSLDLSEQGTWSATAHIENSTQPPQSLLKLPVQRGYIHDHGIVSFYSLTVELMHPLAYSIKMAIPTWGPIAFVSMIFLVQFCPLRRRIGRSDHISFFVAVVIFQLGSTIVTREFTPPELTLAELVGLVATFLYAAALACVIYRRSYDAR